MKRLGPGWSDRGGSSSSRAAGREPLTQMPAPSATRQDPFWLKAIDATGRNAYPALIASGTTAALINARNYVNLLRIAQRVTPVAEEMLELAVPMLGGEE